LIGVLLVAILAWAWAAVCASREDTYSNTMSGS
jgi:hypothetical protein